MLIDGVLIGALLGIAEFVVIAIAARVVSSHKHQAPAKKSKQLAQRLLLATS